MKTAAPSPTRRRRWRWLLGVAAGAIGVAAVTELTLRVIAAFPSDTPCFVADPQTGFRFRPRIRCGGVVTNALGYADVDRAVAKAAGTTRLAFVGDSFVVGSVDPADSFVSLTQRRAGQAGIPVEVLNLGLIGAGLRNYLGVAGTEIPRLDLDAICVVVFVGNDILQAHPDFWTTTWLGAPHETLRRPYLLGWSANYFYAARTSRMMWRSLYDRWFVRDDETFSQSTYFSIERERMTTFARRPSAFVRAAYAGAADLLQRIVAEAESKGIAVTVVLAPDEIQVNEPLRTAVAEAYSLDLSEYDFERPQAVLSPMLKARSVPVLDLLPPLRAATGDLYHKHNTHWNERGNRVVADAVWPFLVEHRGFERRR